MTLTTSSLVASLGILISLICPAISATEVPGDDPLIGELNEVLAEAEAPMRELGELYSKNLTKFAEKAQAGGDLDAVMAAKTELESFSEQRERDFRKYPDLQRIRIIYDVNVARLQDELEEDRAEILAEFTPKLEDRVKELTQAGEIERAVALSHTIHSLETHMTEETGETPEPIWEMTSRSSVESHRGCEIEEKEGNLVLSGEHNYPRIASRRTFSPPIRIKARAKTDSTNIRIYYSPFATAIFNSEIDPTILYLRSPHGPRFEVPDGGKIESNTFLDIEMDVLPGEILLRVNGEERGGMRGEFGELDETVGIGPGFGSTVTVESLAVYPID